MRSFISCSFDIAHSTVFHTPFTNPTCTSLLSTLLCKGPTASCFGNIQGIGHTFWGADFKSNVNEILKDICCYSKTKTNIFSKLNIFLFSVQTACLQGNVLKQETQQWVIPPPSLNSYYYWERYLFTIVSTRFGLLAVPSLGKFHFVYCSRLYLFCLFSKVLWIKRKT